MTSTTELHTTTLTYQCTYVQPMLNFNCGETVATAVFNAFISTPVRPHWTVYGTLPISSFTELVKMNL